MTKLELSRPRVSIGMPLYNAERYLVLTLESILAQSFTDFELVISDNGSTDGTESICRAHAANDKRVRYYRENTNRGAAWNHNRVFALSRGEYFKWASYDDLLGRQFLERCVAVLDRHPSVVLCCTKVTDIDDVGQCMAIKSSKASSLLQPHQRLRALTNKGHTCEEVYGLIRSDVLGKTPLIASYTSSDQNLLVELSLYGQFYEVPEALFFHRWHARSTYYLWPSRVERWLWFDPHAKGRNLFPYWKQLYEYLSTIWRVPIRWSQRVRCYLHMVTWLKECIGYLASDLYWGCRDQLIRWIKKHLPWVRSTYRDLRSRVRT